MRLAVLVLAVVSAASAVPFDLEQARIGLQSTDAKTSSRIFEDIILEVLEGVRELMLNGSDTVPVLDPLVIEDIVLDGEDFGLPDARVSLSNMSVQGLSTFDFDELTVSMASLILQRYRADFNAFIPTVAVNTENYDLSIKIFGGLIFGNGYMKLNIVNSRVKGFITVAVRLSSDGIFLTIHECNIGVGLDAFEPEITGLFGNEGSSEFVSEFLKTLIPELLEFFEDDITNFISSTVLTVGNAILADLNLIDLIGSRNMDALRVPVENYH